MISLGCPKTLVDSEVILGKLDPAQFEFVKNEKDCDVALINTCSFILDAKQESIDRILELIQLKQKGRIRAIVVMACLVQQFPEALKEEFREVDAFAGTGDFQKIESILSKVLNGKKVFEVGKPGYLQKA